MALNRGAAQAADVDRMSRDVRGDHAGSCIEAVGGDQRRDGDLAEGLWPLAPCARRIPSITDQLTPFALAADFRLAANFDDSRSAGGVGSGSGELSQTVAALAGPSISGAGAFFSFGSRTFCR